MAIAEHPILPLILLVSLSTCTIASQSVFAGESPFGRDVQTISFSGDVKAIAWSRDQTHLAMLVSGENAPYDGGNLCIYDLAQGRLLEPSDVQRGARITNTAIAFDPTGRYVIAISPPETSAASRGENQRTLNENRDYVFTLIPIEGSGEIRYVRDKTIDDPGFQVPPDRIVPQLATLALSPEGTTLASAMSHSGTVALYDTHSWTLRKHVGAVSSVPWQSLIVGGVASGYVFDSVFLDTKRDILIAKGITTVVAWDVASNVRISSFRPFAPDVANVITYNPVAGTVIAGGGGTPDANDPFLEQVKRTNGGKLPFLVNTDTPYTAVRAWNPITGQQILTYAGPNMRVQSLAVSPDGHYLAAAQGGGLLEAYVLLWDANTGQPLSYINYGKGHWVRALAFSPDSRKLAYAVDSTAQIVEIDPTHFSMQGN